MARELIVKIKCDICKKDVSESDVKAGELTIGGKTYGIDFCNDCEAQFTFDLVPKAKALQEANKVQVQYPSNKKGKVLPCPACGHLVKNELGLSFHIKKMHPGSDVQQYR